MYHQGPFLSINWLPTPLRVPFVFYDDCMSLFECFDQIVTTVLSVDLLLSWWTSTGTQSLSSPKTALNLIHVGGRKVVVSLKNNFGTVKCLCHTQLHRVYAVALMSICPQCPSHAARRSAGVCTSADWGALRTTRTCHWPLTSIKFPLLASATGFLILLRVVETGSGRSLGTHVLALSVHTCYIFMCDLLRSFGFLGSLSVLKQRKLCLRCWNWLLSRFICTSSWHWFRITDRSWLVYIYPWIKGTWFMPAS